MTLIIFIEFVYRFNLNSQATSNIWMKEVLNKSGLNTRTYMRDYKIRTNDGIVFFRPIKGTYWVLYIWIDTTLILTEVHLKLWAELFLKEIETVFCLNIRSKQVIVLSQHFVYLIFTQRRL